MYIFATHKCGISITHLKSRPETLLMKISILQTDIEWSLPLQNAQKAEALISSVPPSDVYVLPEMWSTGFATQARGIAEDDDQSLQWMRRTARRTGSAICGSVSIVWGDSHRNRHYFVRPDGTYDFYDKHHLFRHGGEDREYESGDKRTIAEWQGMRFLLLTCYDLRFPLWCRYREDYDAIIVVANWPKNRMNAWHILLRARAIENQCYVIGANRVGRDPYCQYTGHSVIIDPKGFTVSGGATEGETIVSGEISLEEVQSFREKFEVLKDRDNYTL